LAIKGEGLYLRGRKRNVNYRVVAVAIVLLVVVLFMGIRIRQNAVEKSRNTKANEELVREARLEVEALSSNTVFTINSPDNLTERESVLNQIDTLEDKLKNIKVTDEYKSEIEGYSKQVADLEIKLRRIINLSNPTMIADLGANFEGADPSDITSYNGKIYVSDKLRNVIYEIDPAGGNSKEVLKTDLKGPKFISTDPQGGIVVLDESDTTALGLFNPKTGSFDKFVGMASGKFATAVEMKSYEVGKNDIRLYLAMSGSPQVQQINKRSNAYSDGPRSRWQGDEFAGLSDIDLLDGKFLLIKTGEGLVRYFAQSKLTTTVGGLLGGDSLSTATKMATDPLYIYISDPADKRVLVFSKSRGNNLDYVDLVAQYKYTGNDGVFGDVVDIAVDSSNIYVLDSAKVYKLPKSDFQSYLF